MSDQDDASTLPERCRKWLSGPDISELECISNGGRAQQDDMGGVTPSGGIAYSKDRTLTRLRTEFAEYLK